MGSNNTSFRKGQSGNPGGRPKGLTQLRELARVHTQEAFETLIEIMRDKGAKEMARLSAANSVLDRAWGRPIQDTGLEEDQNSKLPSEMTFQEMREEMGRMLLVLKDQVPGSIKGKLKGFSKSG